MMFMNRKKFNDLQTRLTVAESKIDATLCRIREINTSLERKKPASTSENAADKIREHFKAIQDILCENGDLDVEFKPTDWIVVDSRELMRVDILITKKC